MDLKKENIDKNIELVALLLVFSPRGMRWVRKEALQATCDRFNSDILHVHRPAGRFLPFLPVGLCLKHPL